MNSLDIMNNFMPINSIYLNKLSQKRKFTKMDIKSRESKYPISIKEIKYLSNSHKENPDKIHW